MAVARARHRTAAALIRVPESRRFCPIRQDNDQRTAPRHSRRARPARGSNRTGTTGPRISGGPMKPGRHNALIDVAGLRVGHHTVVGKGFLTGTTVILAPDDGMVAGVDVRGGGPATRETDLLGPTASVERVHAIVLSGGSAFATSTGTGVADQLAARRVGLRVGPHPDAVVPLVPGAS